MNSNYMDRSNTSSNYSLSNSNNSNATNTITVKAKTKDHIRRFKIDKSINLDQFCQQLTKIFNLSLSLDMKNTVLTYKDDEGDFITVSTEQEWNDAKTFFSTPDLQIQFRNRVPNKTGEDVLKEINQRVSNLWKDVTSGGGNSNNGKTTNNNASNVNATTNNGTNNTVTTQPQQQPTIDSQERLRYLELLKKKEEEEEKQRIIHEQEALRNAKKQLEEEQEMIRKQQELERLRQQERLKQQEQERLQQQQLEQLKQQQNKSNQSNTLEESWTFIPVNRVPEDLKDEPPSARFLRDLNFEDNTIVKPGDVITKKWLIKNTGSSAWPIGTHLAVLDAKDIEIIRSNVPIALPNQDVEVSVEIRLPQKEGKVKAFFRLESPKNEMFGATLWLDLSALFPQMSPQMQQQQIYQQQQFLVPNQQEQYFQNIDIKDIDSDDEDEEDSRENRVAELMKKYENELNMLSIMGLSKKERLAEILDDNGGDITKTVQKFILESSQQL
ncbi:hypothetical protein ABK040_007768 [Willaertia magna]